MKASIIIPTYWRGPSADGNTCEFESDFIYDHATPLDSEGTLIDTLESLTLLEDTDDLSVVVLAVPTRPELKQAVELRVQTIVAQFEYRYPIMVIGPEEIMLWRRRLAAMGLYQYDHLLSLDGYANVRNMCLLAAVLSSADVAVFLEDGETIDDPAYLRKAMEFIGGERDGTFVAAVAGCLRREDGTFLLPPADEAWQDKWGRVSSMNQLLGGVSEEPRLKKTTYVNAGNMVLHRRVFEQVPFDPTIPRGEAVDYLLNARLAGFDFFIDNDLWIRAKSSLPCAPSWFQLRLDIIRFARERAKLAAARGGGIARGELEAENFDPYPGRFLRSNLHDIVFETSMEMASGYFFAGREEDANESIMNIAISKAEYNEGGDPLEGYLSLQQQWREFVSIVPRMGIWHSDSLSD